MAKRTRKKSETLESIFKPIMEDNPVFEGPLDFVREYEQNPHPEPCRCNVIRVTGACSTCGSTLFNEFPEGFPKEWKMCCFCKMMAEHIAHRDGFFYSSSKRIEKIKKLITLVG